MPSTYPRLTKRPNSVDPHAATAGVLAAARDHHVVPVVRVRLVPLALVLIQLIRSREPNVAEVLEAPEELVVAFPLDAVAASRISSSSCPR